MSKAALKQADRAARMDKPDWQILPKLKTDGVGLLLPDLQKMRELAAGLQDRFRDEIALRRFDDAIYTAQTMFALSRHMGEHPTLIGELVAIAIAFITISPLEDMLQQPGCPNLYWALTSLPTPLITLNKGMEGERLLTVAELHDLDDQKPMTAEQLKKLIARIDLLRDSARSMRKPRVAFRRRTGREVSRDRSPAVGRIRHSERPARALLELSGTLARRKAGVRHPTRRDDEAPQPSHVGSDWRLGKVRIPKDRLIGDLFLPALQKVRIAQGRLEQKIALLRHVEALRMYAAAHDGKLPEKLADVDVPLPLDPFIGKPFRYELKDGVAHLRGTPPKGYEEIAIYNLHYEITIRK